MALFTPLDVRSASDRMLETDVRPPQKWSETASSDRPRMLSRTSDRLSSRDKMSRTPNSSTNQTVLHGVPSNVHSFLVSHLDLWKGKFVWFCNNIHPTNSTKLHWIEGQPAVKELNSELTLFWGNEQRMVVLFGNTGSVPLIGSKVIQDRTSHGSVWSEKGPRI